MFVAIFVFVLATTYAAELPSYINVCTRKTPNLNQCVMNNMENLKDTICNGLEEFGIPMIEPIKIDKLIIFESNNNKIHLNDVQITGICNYKSKANVDFDELNFEFILEFGEIYINATYDVDVRILVPLVVKAPLSLIPKNAIVNMNIKGKKITKDGKVYIYASDVRTKIDINEYTTKDGFSENESNQLNQVINGLLGSNQREFIDRFTPPLEKEISKLGLLIFNNICKRYTYNELYPDGE